MDYQEQIEIGVIFNSAIEVAFSQSGVRDVLEERPELISQIAQEVLVKLDQSGFEIRKKGRR